MSDVRNAREERTGMCRLLGVVTRAPLPLDTALDGLVGPFTELSLEHRDGWGIAAGRGSGSSP